MIGIRFILAGTCAALSIPLAIGTAPAGAQETAALEEREVMEEIVVVAPRIVRERGPGGGAEIITTTLDARVSYADLDLTQSADVLELEDRVAQAARRICEELATQHPLGQPSTPDCIRRAAADAMGLVREAVRETVGR